MEYSFILVEIQIEKKFASDGATQNPTASLPPLAPTHEAILTHPLVIKHYKNALQAALMFLSSVNNDTISQYTRVIYHYIGLKALFQRFLIL